ncbi:MAG: hypothetical protein ACRC0G_04030, partial [Fusobacteriaceae bacterium]
EEEKEKAHKKLLLQKSEEILELNKKLEVLKNKDLEEKKLKELQITEKEEIEQNTEVIEQNIFEEEKHWKDYDINSLSKSELLKIASNFTLKEIEEIRVESKQRNLLTQLQRVQLSDIENWIKHGTILNSFNIEALEIIYVNLMNYLAKEKVEREKRAKDNDTILKFEGKWCNYEKYLQNKNNLIPLLNNFDFQDFQEIYQEGKRRGVLNYKDEKDLKSILTRLKLNLPLTTFGIEKVAIFYKELMEDIKKYPEKISIKKSVEEENVEKLVEEPEKVAQIPSFNGKWCNYEKFSQNKNYLIDFLRTFNANDFREMQLEGKKRGLLKFGQERDISNIITRLKLELLLTEFSLEKVEPFYESLMEDIYKESNLEKPTEKPVEKVTVETNVNPVDSNVEKDFDIESYTAKDWYKLYELSKNDKNIKEWLRKYIFTIGRYMQENLPITSNQYSTIRNNYAELYFILGKLEKNRA